MLRVKARQRRKLEALMIKHADNPNVSGYIEVNKLMHLKNTQLMQAG